MTVAIQAGMFLANQGNNKAPQYQAGNTILGKLLAANMNSTADQAIPMLANSYIIRKIVGANPTANLTLSAGGVYTAAAKGGTAIVPAIQVYTALSSASKYLDLTLASLLGTDLLTQATLYLSLTVAQGGAALMDLYLLGDALS